MRKIRLLTTVLSMVLLFAGCKKDEPAPPAPTINCTSNLAPSNAASVSAGAPVTLTWNSVAGATGYDVYVGSSAATASIVASNVSGTTTNYTVPAGGGLTYYWYVVPRSASGNAKNCQSAATSFTTPANILAPPPFGFYVVGYFPNYRSLTDIPDVKFRMCNVVNYAFFSVNSTGTVTVNNGTLATQFIAKARANNAKPFLSINEAAAGNYKTMASTSAGRTAFVKDVMAKVRQYGFDGVDIDWEFPRTDDGTSVTFTALMKELSDSLHVDARYYLTAAITAGKYAGAIRDAITAEVFNYADWFNIMAYDDFSSTVPYKHHSDYNLAVTCLNYWKNTRGMPAAKIVLGFPAYGRASGITQTGTTMAYRTIIAQGGSPDSDSAIVSQGSFNNYMIYYNGQPTVKKKAIYAKQQGNGVMMWEKWQDTHDATSLLKAACDTVGRAY